MPYSRGKSFQGDLNIMSSVLVSEQKILENHSMDHLYKEEKAKDLKLNLVECSGKVTYCFMFSINH